MLQGARRRRLSREGRVEAAIGHPVHEVIIGTGREFQTDVRVAAMKVRQHARQPARRRALERAQSQHAARNSAGDDGVGLARELNEAFGVAQQQLAGGGEMKPLAVAVKQRHAHRGFELLDPRRDARRHPVQLARGFDDAAFVDHALEHLQIDQIHRRYPFTL